jgi:putative tryptophan/tyrosine transport system substrate-binding protein
MTLRFRKFGFLGGLAIAGLALLGLVAPVAAKDGPSWSWFKYETSIEKDWLVVDDPANPKMVTVQPIAEQKTPKKRVLVLYPRPSSAYDIAITRLLQVFAVKEINADFTAINFGLNDAEGNAAIKYAQANRFDLIFSMGSESTAWLYDNFRGGSIPVVTVCSKDPVQLGQMTDYESGSGNNFAFTSLNMVADAQLAYVISLKPNLKNLAILVDSKNISAVQTQAEPIAAHAAGKGVNVIMGSVKNPAQAREELVHIVADAVRVMRITDPTLSNSAFLITGSTSVFKEIKTINKGAGRVPVLSMIPEIVTAGEDTAVLATGISFESNAHLAAVYGADILARRAKVGDLKVGIVSPPDIAISFLRARQINMNVPFSFFEAASFVYDYDGLPVRRTRNE